MDMRDQILREARSLTIARGVIPSLNAVADAAGVSKGGLIHHFPTRNALVEALGRQALAEVDTAMAEAAAHGRAAREWLSLSVPRTPEREVYRALVTAYQAMHAPLGSLMTDATAITDRWEAMIALEVGDPIVARVVRLVGDGLIANALMASDPAFDDGQIDALLAAITRSDVNP